MRRVLFIFFFSSRRRHTRSLCDWSSDVCSSDLTIPAAAGQSPRRQRRPGTTGDRRCRGSRPKSTSRGAGESEERRVGKECRSRWWRDHKKKKREKRVSKGEYAV